jgi:hypothetical protein
MSVEEDVCIRISYPLPMMPDESEAGMTKRFIAVMQTYG